MKKALYGHKNYIMWLFFERKMNFFLAGCEKMLNFATILHIKY